MYALRQTSTFRRVLAARRRLRARRGRGTLQQCSSAAARGHPAWMPRCPQALSACELAGRSASPTSLHGLTEFSALLPGRRGPLLPMLTSLSRLGRGLLAENGCLRSLRSAGCCAILPVPSSRALCSHFIGFKPTVRSSQTGAPH